MTRFLDAALRFGLGVLLACAGLSAASAAQADAPRVPEVLDASAGIVRSNPSAPAAQVLVRAGFVRFEARRVPAPVAAPSARSAAPSPSSSAVPAAPAVAGAPGIRPGDHSRGPPASA